MKETTDEKKEKIFQLADIEPYEEFSDDGREYSTSGNLERLNLYLQTSNYGVVIAGNKGAGKTALVRQFANQRLNRVFKMDNVKVIHFKEGYLSNKVSVDQILKYISDIIMKYKSDAIILYVKLQKKEELEIIKNVAAFFGDFVKFYNLQSLKAIVEATTENSKEMDFLTRETSSLFNLITCTVPKNINATINMLMPRIDEMSIEYGVGYNREMLQFFYVIAHGLNVEETITNTYLNVLECAFILSRRDDFTVLDKSVAKYIVKTAFEKLDNMTEQQKYLVAAHEAGHTLLYLVSNNKNAGFVSIIPGSDYVGVTMYDEKVNTLNSRDREFFIKDIAISLAGRIGEAIFTGEDNPTDSASADLSNAMNKINHMLFDLGLSKTLGENYVLLGDKERMSEALTVRVEAEKRDILNEAKRFVKKSFEEHKDFFLKLTKRLADELCICTDDLYDMWNEYLKSKEEQEKSKRKIEA